MSELLKKAKENYKSADLLCNRHKMWASSVHCSYYSCLQVIIHLIEDKTLNAKWEAFQKNAKGDKNIAKEDLGMHNMYINFMKKQIMEVDYDSLRIFGKIDNLKKARVASAYLNDEITEQRANSSIERAKEVRDLLIENFIKS